MNKRILIPAILTVLGVIVLAGAYLERHTIMAATATITANVQKEPHDKFPAIDETKLTPQQVALLKLARTEYAKHPVSFDQDVLVYTEGNKEAWCADFVSWLMRETGVPYANPNSGSWRIPGVLTLQEFYQNQGRYTEVADYRPQPGDVAFFIGKNSRDVFSRQHVAMVVAVDGDTMTTLGGNEGGHMRIRMQKIAAGEDSLAGFGIFDVAAAATE